MSCPPFPDKTREGWGTHFRCRAKGGSRGRNQPVCVLTVTFEVRSKDQRYTVLGWREFKRIFRFVLMGAPMMAWGQTPLLQSSATNHPAITSPIPDLGNAKT